MLYDRVEYVFTRVPKSTLDVSSNPSSIEFSSEKRPSDGIVPNDSKIRVLVHDSRTQAVRTIL